MSAKRNFLELVIPAITQLKCKGECYILCSNELTQPSLHPIVEYCTIAHPFDFLALTCEAKIGFGTIGGGGGGGGALRAPSSVAAPSLLRVLM